MNAPRLVDVEGRATRPAWAIGVVFILSYLMAHLHEIIEAWLLITRGTEQCLPL